MHDFIGESMASSLVQVRIDDELKAQVAEIYESFGIDLPTAIRIFFKKTISMQGLPFDLRYENQANRWAVYDNARQIIQKNNVPEMTLEEINNEINAARHIQNGS